MKTKVPYLFTCALSIAAFILVPLTVLAEGQSEVDQALASPVIITEVQTGDASASEEFVELFNASDSTVDITGWQVRFNAAGTANYTTTLLATIGSETPVLLPGKSYFVLHTSNVALPNGALGQEYSAVLSKSDKTVALFARDKTVCEMVVHDAVAWETMAGTTLGEGQAVSVTTAANSEKLLQRYINEAGDYVDTNNNAYDFYLAQGTPGDDNVNAPHGIPQGSTSELQSFAAPDCNLPPNEEPPVEEPPVTDPNEGLDAPTITELLPNPGPPLTDADDEFIELYNPNEAPFDLSGFKLEAGITTKYSYTFAEGTILEPQTYVAFYSKDTNIALSNSNGQVRLKDGSGAVLNETASYTSAGNDQAWALIEDTWAWAVAPTPNQANEGSEEPPVEDPPTEEPPVEDPTPNEGLLLPQITELLPDPGAGLSDSEDEFIELYNPNDKQFDLGGYIIETGTTNLAQHVIPQGIVIQPHSYLALFSADTDGGPLLVNSGGQVRLLDPKGTPLSQTDAYPKAKADQAWALINGVWQWTLKPTPNAENIAQLPAIATTGNSKTKAASTTKKSAAKKTATKTKSTKNDNEDRGAVAAITKPSDPLHPGLLALVGVFALLYGAYEYRHDMANKVRIFRTNREARRALGQGAKGR